MKLKPKYFEDFEVGLIFESEPSLISFLEIKEGFDSKVKPTLKSSKYFGFNFIYECY